MEKQFMPNETPEVRVKNLEAQANLVTKAKYFVRLGDDELINARAAFTKNRLAMDDLEEQKKEVMDDFKEQMKPLKEIDAELSQEVRKGFREQEGKLFGFIEGNMVYFYDSKGELIETETRPATVSELSQKTIFMEIKKTGTDD